MWSGGAQKNVLKRKQNLQRNEVEIERNKCQMDPAEDIGKQQKNRNKNMDWKEMKVKSSGREKIISRYEIHRIHDWGPQNF